MRYIIEASLLQAGLMNRTLILPSFVYARGCEDRLDVCAACLEMVNRGDAMGLDEWRGLRMDKQMGWKVPIEMILDLDHLRETHPVVTMSEYLKLHDISPGVEQGDGQWSDDAYHVRSRLISNSWWDPPGVIRVDVQRTPLILNESKPGYIHAFEVRESVKATLEGMMEIQEPDLQQQTVLEWVPVQKALLSMEIGVRDDDETELFLRAAGFDVLHTFQGSRGAEFGKSVAIPITQVVRTSEVRGAVDDFGSWADEVIHLEGEMHDNRKPGFLRFTNIANFQYFTQTVLHDMRSPPHLAALAVQVGERMRRRADGRLWRAAHFRRGDFIKMGWASSNIRRHIDLVKKKLSLASEKWREIRSNETANLNIPKTRWNPTMFEGEIPRDGDPFYIATDERRPQILDYIRSQGGVLIMDLLEPQDREVLGCALQITDILAVVDQHVLARAAYFYGDGRSSVTGGVLNLRSIHGWDSRTTDVE